LKIWQEEHGMLDIYFQFEKKLNFSKKQRYYYYYYYLGGMELYETSALNGQGVDSAFYHLAKR
jgi:hypothetical protein